MKDHFATVTSIAAAAAAVVASYINLNSCCTPSHFSSMTHLVCHNCIAGGHCILYGM